MREKPELFLDNLRWVRSDPKYGDLGIVKFIMSLRNLEELSSHLDKLKRHDQIRVT